MLMARVITALVLLAIILPVLYARSYVAFAGLALAFFVAAMWECQRLFKKPLPWLMAGVWGLALAYLLFNLDRFNLPLLFALVTAFWVLRLMPVLARGLPEVKSFANGLLSTLYGVNIFACFVAMAVLFQRSPWYLLSVMAIVWVADIGAYFAGKAFGKHKLAPSISPGKSWEGAIGGWLAVLLLAYLSSHLSFCADSFAVHLMARKGILLSAVLLTVLVAVSVTGDLFESALKRRVGMKDSSQLLPGHGGVLDRIDALIPVLPIAALLNMWQ